MEVGDKIKLESGEEVELISNPRYLLGIVAASQCEGCYFDTIGVCIPEAREMCREFLFFKLVEESDDKP